MTQTIVEKSTCESCGVNVREESDFCYNCGEPVALDQAIRIADHGVENNGSVKKSGIVDTGNLQEVVFDKQSDTSRSPAALKKRGKSFRQRPVEVVWEAPEEASRLFVVISILLAFFAALLLFLALYMR